MSQSASTPETSDNEKPMDFIESLDTGGPMGPNVKRLVIRKMALIAVPPGSRGDSFAHAFHVLRSVESLKATAREAAAWVKESLDRIKALPNNSLGDDDETIAGVMLSMIWSREQEMGRKSFDLPSRES
jgi:hypothetical protein